MKNFASFLSSAPSIAAAVASRVRHAQRPLMAQLLFVLAGSWFLAASSWIEIPMFPVPMTMQTYALLVFSALCGWRLAAGTAAAYLVEGVCGLPVFAGGAAGPHHLMGLTGGYLLGFVAAAAAIGWLAERGWTASIVRSFVALTLGHVVVFAFGVTWLSLFVGHQQAIALGLTPFVVGSVVKIVLAVATVYGFQRTYQARKSS